MKRKHPKRKNRRTVIGVEPLEKRQMMAADTGIEVFGDAGRDVLRGTQGEDVLVGNGGHDRLFGSAGNDVLSGGEGNDFLRGGADNDTLSGGSGRDTLDGGAGDDTFIYRSGDGSDRIRNFDLRGNDRLVLDVEGVNDLEDLLETASVRSFGRRDFVTFEFGDGDVLSMLTDSFDNLTEDDFVFSSDQGAAEDASEEITLPNDAELDTGGNVSSARVSVVRNADGTIDVQQDVVGNANVQIRTDRSATENVAPVVNPAPAPTPDDGVNRSSARVSVVRNADGTIDVQEDVVGNANVQIRTDRSATENVAPVVNPAPAPTPDDGVNRSSARVSVVRNADGTIDVQEDVVGNANVQISTDRSATENVAPVVNPAPAPTPEEGVNRSSARVSVVRNANGTIDVQEDVVGNANLEVSTGSSSRLQSLRDRLNERRSGFVRVSSSGGQVSITSSDSARTAAFDSFFARLGRQR